MEANLPTGQPKKSNLVPIILDEEMAFVLAVMLGHAMKDRSAMLLMSIEIAKVGINSEAVGRLQQEVMKLAAFDGTGPRSKMNKDVPPLS